MALLELNLKELWQDPLGQAKFLTLFVSCHPCPEGNLGPETLISSEQIEPNLGARNEKSPKIFFGNTALPQKGQFSQFPEIKNRVLLECEYI